MKQNKARRLTEHLDEKYVLMAAYPEAVFRKHRHGLLMKRILIVAACVAILAVGMVAVLLPALRSDPGGGDRSPRDPEPPFPRCGLGGGSHHCQGTAAQRKPRL